jgi:hypothetical protein
MTPHATLIRVMALVALLLLARGATAHEFWIAPNRYGAAKGLGVELSAVAGTGFRGERKPWSPDHAVRFTLRTSKAIDLTRAASPGELTWTRFAPSDEGGAMVAFESGFLPIELPAADFNHYLKSEGLDAPLAARNGLETPGRERYRRCAKLWLAGTDGARATAPAGLPLELVPASAPGEPTLRLRVLWNGRPLAGALVKAWCTPLSAEGLPRPVFARDSVSVAWQGRSDGAGAVTIPTRASGEWLVSTVHMIPCPDRSAADWESTWASLTFARAAAPATPSDRAASSTAARGTAARP